VHAALAFPLARDGYVNPLANDHHVLGQEADGCCALAEDDGADLSPTALLRRVIDALERDRVPAVLLPDVKVTVGCRQR
jgi:hypothetical protein